MTITGSKAIFVGHEQLNQPMTQIGSHLFQGLELARTGWTLDLKLVSVTNMRMSSGALRRNTVCRA